MHNSSRVTFKALDKSKAVETLQSLFFSMFCIVRLGTPDNLTNAGTDNPCFNLISFRFIFSCPFFSVYCVERQC